MSLYVGHCDVVSPLGSRRLGGGVPTSCTPCDAVAEPVLVKFDDPAAKRMLHAGKIVVGMCPPSFNSS